MALNSVPIAILLLTFCITAIASDPEIIQDFIVPKNLTSINNKFFTYTKTRGIFNDNPKIFTVTKASRSEFPALDGQSVSYEVLQFPQGALNALHMHPRASELLFLVRGVLEVGFVDTKNVLYEQKLKAGDMFVFPKGLVHYQYNRDDKGSAAAISAFTSASPTTVSVPTSVFGAGIDEEILAMSFKTNGDTVKKIRAGINKS
ncbi:hypothetical protein LguiA_031911 [Lonicera macranthoides]